MIEAAFILAQLHQAMPSHANRREILQPSKCHGLVNRQEASDLLWI